MQKRERNYATPPDPFESLASKLTDKPADTALRREIAAWESDYRSGSPAAQSRLASLEAAAAQSSLEAVSLLDAGRAMNYLAGDATGACFYRAGLAKAAVQYKGLQPRDPGAEVLLHTLDQLKALWRLNDYYAMEQRFSLAMSLNPPLSVEARRAGYLHAEMCYYQGRYEEAAEAMQAVQREHEKAGDLGAADGSDVYEMNYIRGLMQYCAGHYEEAIPLFEKVHGGERDELVSRLVIHCLLECDRISEAGACYERYVGQFSPPDAVRDRLHEELDQARRFQLP
jgi:tetratricopeptide (TPR) repeat protein